MRFIAFAIEMSPVNLIAVKARRQYHRSMLLGACLVIAASLVFDVRSDQRVILPWTPGLPLPVSCLSKTLLHVNCPGCGLTRSFIHLAHGRFAQSVALHRLGWLLALTVLLQLPYRIFALFGPRTDPLGRCFPHWFGIMLIVLLIVNWAVNLVLGIQTPLLESSLSPRQYSCRENSQTPAAKKRIVAIPNTVQAVEPETGMKSSGERPAKALRPSGLPASRIRHCV